MKLLSHSPLVDVLYRNQGTTECAETLREGFCGLCSSIGLYVAIFRDVNAESV